MHRPLFQLGGVANVASLLGTYGNVTTECLGCELPQCMEFSMEFMQPHRRYTAHYLVLCKPLLFPLSLKFNLSNFLPFLSVPRA